MKKFYFKSELNVHYIGVGVQVDEETAYLISLEIYGIAEKKNKFQEKLYKAMGEYWRCDLNVGIENVMIFYVCPEIITALNEINETKANDADTAIEILKKYGFVDGNLEEE